MNDTYRMKRVNYCGSDGVEDKLYEKNVLLVSYTQLGLHKVNLCVGLQFSLSVYCMYQLIN